MKKVRFAKTMLAVGVVVACVFGLAACSNSSSSGAVAAKVNGTEIAEQTVTDQIESIRAQSGLSDTDQWGNFLATNSMTPSSVREQIIDSLVQQELVVQGAKDLGVTVQSSEVDEYVNSMKANYDSDDAWNKALQQAGFTEESYRKIIEQSLYQQKVNEHFEKNAELTDEDYVNAAKTYASYYDGAKRSSHILFKVDNANDEAAVAAARAKAEDVLAQINAGTLDFADAAKQYSEDTGSAVNGGDVGWDVLNSFVTEYTNALSGLELNQVSGLVQSTYGFHIIKVTEVFNAPSEITSLDQIPEAFRETMKSMAASIKANSAYTDWVNGLKEKADIKINDMPSGLPYDLDMSKYQTASSSSASASADSSSSDASASAASSDASASAASSDASASSSSESSSSSASSSSAN